MLFDVIDNEPSKLSFLLNEEFFDYYSGKGKYATMLKFAIYKNPDADEINSSIFIGARGWISPSGDLYMEGSMDKTKFESSNVIHEEFIKALKTKFPNIIPDHILNTDGAIYHTNLFTKQCGKYGVLVQRMGSTRTIYLSESFALSAYNQRHLKVILQRAKSKTPDFAFDVHTDHSPGYTPGYS